MTEILTPDKVQPAVDNTAFGDPTQEPGEAGSVDPTNTGEVVAGETEAVELTPEEIAAEMRLAIEAVIQSFEEMDVDERIIYDGYDNTKQFIIEHDSKFRKALNDYLGQLDAIGAKLEAKFAEEVSNSLDQFNRAVEYIYSKPAIEIAEKYKLAKQTVINMDRMLENIATNFKEEGDEIIVNQDVELGMTFRHYWEMTRDDLKDMADDYRKETGLDHDDLLDEAEDHIEAIDAFLGKVKDLEDKLQAEQEAERNKLERLYKDAEIFINKPDGLLYYAIPVASGKKKRIGVSRARDAIGSGAPDGVYKTALKKVKEFDDMIVRISSMPNCDQDRIDNYMNLLRIATEYVYELAKQTDSSGAAGYKSKQVLPQDTNTRLYQRNVTVGVHKAFGEEPLKSIDLSALGFMIPKSERNGASTQPMNGNRANVLYPGYNEAYDPTIDGSLPGSASKTWGSKVGGKMLKPVHAEIVSKFKEKGLDLKTKLIKDDSFEDWLKRAANTSDAAYARAIGNRMIAHFLRRNYRSAGFLVSELTVGNVGKDVSFMKAIIEAAR